MKRRNFLALGALRCGPRSPRAASGKPLIAYNTACRRSPIGGKFADASGLLSYGAGQMENDRNVASYVDRILKGARAADLPALQSSRFELVVNQKTVKALGLTLSPMFLPRRRGD